MSVQGLDMVFSMHACGQLSVLCTWLNELANDYEKEGYLTEQQLLTAMEYFPRIVRCLFVDSIVFHA